MAYLLNHIQSDLFDLVFFIDDRFIVQVHICLMVILY